MPQHVWSRQSRKTWGTRIADSLGNNCFGYGSRKPDDISALQECIKLILEVAECVGQAG